MAELHNALAQTPTFNTEPSPSNGKSADVHNVPVTSQVTKVERMHNVQPIVIAPVAEQTEVAIGVQQRLQSGQSALKNINVRGTLPLAGSRISSGSQPSMVVIDPRQKLVTQANQGYETKIVPQLTPRPSHSLIRTSLPSRPVTRPPVQHGPKVPALSQQRAISSLQSDVMNQLLANPTAAMATFLQNAASGPPIAVTSPTNFQNPIAQQLRGLSTQVSAGGVLRPPLPVPSLVAPSRATLAAMSSLRAPPVLPPQLTTTIMPRLPMQQHLTNTTNMTSGFPPSGFTPPAVAGQPIPIPKVCSIAYLLVKLKGICAYI